jgi:prevent-host-death family protein
MGMVEVGVHEAKSTLSQLLRRVAAGEEVIITRSGEPVAVLVPPPRRAERAFGADRGRFEVPADFDAPLPEDVQRAFDGP